MEAERMLHPVINQIVLIPKEVVKEEKIAL
jgi:hypothetical protein